MQKNPALLHDPSYAFVAKFITAHGGHVPPAPAATPAPAPAPAASTPAAASSPSAHGEEPDDGVLEHPDTDAARLPLGDRARAVSEADEERAQKHKSLGMAAMNDGNLDDAVANFTEAIQANPKLAVLFALRGQVSVPLSICSLLASETSSTSLLYPLTLHVVFIVISMCGSHVFRWILSSVLLLLSRRNVVNVLPLTLLLLYDSSAPTLQCVTVAQRWSSTLTLRKRF